ncbi:MAG: sulfotransferase family 2 domain-containing protein [Pseudomonadota bacterium]
MLVFHRQKLVVLAVPRTGSTSLHRALSPFADIEFTTPPGRKHMSARGVERWAQSRPRAVESYKRIAVVRDPLARIISWYSYRKRKQIAGQPASTRGMSFDAFVRATLSDSPPPAAQVGNQHRFLCDAEGALAVDEIFCLERTDVLVAYLRGIFGVVEFPHRNASRPQDVTIDPALEAELRAARAEEFALFEQVAQRGRLTVSR